MSFGLGPKLRKLPFLPATCTAMLLAVVPFSIPAGADDIAQGAEGGSPAVVEGGGPAYVMPPGDHTRGSATPGKAVPLRVPGGDAAYREMKDRIAREPATGPGDRGLAPEAGQKSEAVIAPTCPTNSSTGFFPSDIHGAVGTTNMVVVTNVDVGVFNRATCAVVSNVSLKTFFNNFFIPATDTLFDPRVIRDSLTGRFFLTAESLSSINNNQFQYFAVSTDSLGTSWFRYRTTLSSGAAFFCKKAVNSFWDYPSAGSSNLRWFISANDFGPTTDTSAVLTINKAPTLTGALPTVRCYRALTPFINLAPPIIRDNSTVATFLGTGSGSGTVLFRRDYVMDPANHALDVMFSRPNYDVANWIAPRDARQPNLQELDSLDGRFQSASIQSLGQLWNTHSVQAGSVPAARVYRLGNAGAGASPVLNQVFAPCTQSPCDDQINPSLGTRGEAGMPLFVTFTRTNSNAGFAATGRAAMVILRAINDTFAGFTSNTVVTSATQFTTECTAALGCVPCNAADKGACRWGDYSATQLDPSSNSVGFGWNQIITGALASQWSTRGGKRN